MLQDIVRKKFYAPLLGGTILGLVAFGCDRAEQPYGERQSQRSQQEREQGEPGGLARQSPQQEPSRQSTREPSPQQSAQQSSQESSIEGTVVKIDRNKKEIVVDTNEGQKTVQIENNTEGVEKANEGARVTIQVSGSGDKLKARKIQVSMAEPERPMPRG